MGKRALAFITPLVCIFWTFTAVSHTDDGIVCHFSPYYILISYIHTEVLFCFSASSPAARSNLLLAVASYM